MSETKKVEKPVVEVETVITKRIFNPNKQQFELSLWHVVAQLDPEEWCKRNQCPVCGARWKTHEFVVANGLVIEICKPQQATQAAVPLFERGEPLAWTTVVKEKRLTIPEARKLLKEKGIVATPDVTFFLLRGK